MLQYLVGCDGVVESGPGSHHSVAPAGHSAQHAAVLGGGGGAGQAGEEDDEGVVTWAGGRVDLQVVVQLPHPGPLRADVVVLYSEGTLSERVDGEDTREEQANYTLLQHLLFLLLN